MSKSSKREIVEADGASANPRTSGILEITDLDRQVARESGVDLQGTVSDRLARAAQATNMAYRHAIEAGYLLLSVKAELEHGAFGETLAEIGMSSQRASELMRMAKFASSLPEDRRAEMLTLPKTKVLALASADPQVVEELLESGVGDVGKLTLRELREELSAAQQRSATLEKNLEREIKGQRAEIEILNNKLAAAKARGERLPFEMATVAVREEALAAHADVELAAAAMQKMFGLAVSEDVRGENSAETPVRIEQVWTTANVMLARMAALVQGMRNQAAEHDVALSDQLQFQNILTDEEAADWLLAWNTIVRTKEAEAFVREQARIDAAGRGRGRPAKGPAPVAKKSK